VRLQGKIAVVTGAASGIGRGIAAAFDAHGAELVLLDRDEAGLEETRASLTRVAEAAVVDLSVAASVDAAFDGILDRRGRIDVVAHSAALDQPVMAAVDIDDALWARIMETNVNGAFYTNRAALRSMRDRPGSIVNVVSDLGYVAVPGLAAYCASKGAVLQLTRVLAAEAAPLVRVNAICPTMVDTPMGRRSLASRPDPEAYLAEIASEIPMKRIAAVDDVVGAAVFLASDEASYITGVALPIDGGRTVI
jgi:NAD(P)-dependent dehydrogenase (short-subunit alcohol dehydrogenase family)